VKIHKASVACLGGVGILVRLAANAMACIIGLFDDVFNIDPGPKNNRLYGRRGHRNRRRHKQLQGPRIRSDSAARSFFQYGDYIRRPCRRLITVETFNRYSPRIKK
jgi:hypothetical protein